MISLLLSHWQIVLAFLVGALVHKGWLMFRDALEGQWKAVLTILKASKLGVWLANRIAAHRSR